MIDRGLGNEIDVKIKQVMKLFERGLEARKDNPDVINSGLLLGIIDMLNLRIDYLMNEIRKEKAWNG